jgi:hypothetical protein
LGEPKLEVCLDVFNQHDKVINYKCEGHLSAMDGIE